MQRIISIEDAGKLSFPDCPISYFEFEGKALRFVSNGVFIDGEGLIEKRTTVECLTAAPVRSRRFAAGSWVDADPGSDGLQSVDEWFAEGTALRFAGFGVATGEWREFVIRTTVVNLTIEAAS